MEKILTVNVNCYGQHSVKTDSCTMLQIMFDGTAEGKYFSGKILPGGVDTQTIYPDGTGHMSARYTLEGLDIEGLPCRIYIDNEAELGMSETHPTICTDSKALSRFNTAALIGKITITDMVTIEIFEQ